MGIKKFFTGAPGEETDESPRIVVKEQIMLTDRILYVLRDTETGVEYITGSGAHCPVTPLLDPDGTPHVGD